jgi:hypothetical protein
LEITVFLEYPEVLAGAVQFTTKKILIYIFPKKVLPSLTPKYQLNIFNQNYNIKFGMMILWRSTVLDVPIQLPA